MSLLRGDVLITGFVLAVPVLMLGLRGDLSVDEVTVRLLWCLAAGYVAVALVRFASTPRPSARPAEAPAPSARPVPPPAEQLADSEPATS